MRQIIYIANCRMPSETAHSLQIMKMCKALSAFSKSIFYGGFNLTLLVPSRRTDLKADPFEYYGVPCGAFEIEKRPSLDLFGLFGRGKFAFWVHAVSYAFFVWQYIRKQSDTKIFSRDPVSAFLLVFLGYAICYEVHDAPKKNFRNKWFFTRVEKIVATNEAKRDELVNVFGVSKEKILVAHNGVDLFKNIDGHYQSVYNSSSSSQNELPGNKRKIVYTGSLKSWKGVETVAQALRYLPSDIIFLVIGGTQEDQQGLKQWYIKEGLPIEKIELIVQQPHDKLPEFLAEADIVVVPNTAKEEISRIETSPIKLFEALASSRPVVASDVPSIREVTDHALDKRPVVIFAKPDDPHDWAKKISELFELPDNKKQEMTQAAFELASGFTWDGRARNILKFLSMRVNMTMENIKCAICGVDDMIILFTKGDLTADIINVVCRRCGLVYMNPRPTPEAYRQFHVEDFLRERHGLVCAEQVAPKVKGSDLKMKSEVAEFIASNLKPGAKVLDVGCGFGTLLNILKTKYDATVQGIEPATVDVQAAKAFYGLELFAGSLKEFFLKYPDKKFDCIILHHTFEHMSEPHAELATMREMLTQGGILYIGVPNVMNLKKRPEIFFQMGHPYSYSPSTLQKILSLEGFKIIKFNRKAAFPGAMEILAMHDQDLGNIYPNAELKEGSNQKQVYNHIHWSRRKFALLRGARNVALFWLPENIKLKISHFILQILKKL